MTTEQQKIKRDAWKDAGLCYDCGTPVATGHIKCQKCLDQTNKRGNLRRAKRQDAGLCIECGNHPAKNKSGSCEICTLKKAAKHHFGSVKHYKELMKLFLKQKGICVYTGIPLKLGENASLDHRIPRAKGGKDEIQNLQWIHKAVNTIKGDLDEAEFLAMFREFIEHCSHHLTIP